jgi:hypothetical protein
MFEPYDAKASRTVPMGGKCVSTYLSKQKKKKDRPEKTSTAIWRVTMRGRNPSQSTITRAIRDDGV